MIPLIEPKDIQVRIAMQNEKGTSLLLYKDARFDMRMMDSVYGELGWARRHRIEGDMCFCTVSVKDKQTGEWVCREDVGKPSKTDPQKGSASDAFKRACFNFGIGVELYTAPFIWVSKEKMPPNDLKFANTTVQEVQFDAFRTMNYLVLEAKGVEIFSFGKKTVKISENAKRAADYCKKTGYGRRDLLEEIHLAFGTKQIDDIDKDAFEKFIKKKEMVD